MLLSLQYAQLRFHVFICNHYMINISICNVPNKWGDSRKPLLYPIFQNKNLVIRKSLPEKAKYISLLIQPLSVREKTGVGTVLYPLWSSVIFLISFLEVRANFQQLPEQDWLDCLPLTCFSMKHTVSSEVCLPCLCSETLWPLKWALSTAVWK